MYLRRSAATDAGMGNVGGAAADIHHHGVVAAVVADVVMHRGRCRFFEKIHVVETGGDRSGLQDLQRLRIAGLTDGTAKLHRPAQGGVTDVDVELA